MHLDTFFHLALLSQIIVLSYYLPKKVYDRIRYVLHAYAPSKYPNLYPEPVERYEKATRTYKWANVATFLVGLGLLTALILTTRSGEWDSAIVTWYYMLQMSPLVLAELWAVRHYRQMREMDARTTRSAELQPRRLLDFVSPVLVGVAAFVYFAFCAFVVYIRQFDYPWFGGYLNIVIITAFNVVLGAIVIRKLRGKKLDPYQDHGDRMSQLGLVINQLFLMSIAATLYAAITITLASLELRHVQASANCLYFVVLFTIFYGKLRIDNLNFEVYRADSPGQGSPPVSQNAVNKSHQMLAMGVGLGILLGAFVGAEFGESLRVMVGGVGIGAILGATVSTCKARLI